MSRWISVRKDMPVYGRTVLVASKDPFASQTVWLGYRVGDFWRDAMSERVIRVTHWMDLPEPPRSTTDRRRSRRAGGADGAGEPALGV